MTRLAVLADLHFGSVPAGLAHALRSDIEAMRPAAVVVAGDLTLSASRAEFEAARTWLAQIDARKIVIPGNHDLQGWNMWDRFTRPYARFDAVMREHRLPELKLDGCTVFALDTTARWQPHFSWQEGRVRRRDAARLDARLRACEPDQVKIVVAHHPFSPVADLPRARPVRRALGALDIFARRGVSIVFSGHIHRSYVVPVTHRGTRVIAVGAPTALSWRQRGEENGYWLADVTPEAIELSLRLRDGTAFKEVSRQRHAIATMAGREEAPATTLA